MQLYSKKLGEGKPLIIMHGLFGMSDNWQTLGKKWAEQFEVHLLDMRNHGRSSHSEEFSYEIMSDDLAEYFEKENLGKAHILGHSMGGKVAMLFAVLNPNQLDKLIVADISPKYYKPHHGEIITALKGLDLPNLKSRGEAEKQFAQLLDDAGVRQFLLKSLYWESKEKLNWRFNLEAIANRIENVGTEMPSHAIHYGDTLFVRGGKSNYIQQKDIDLIVEHFPDAEIETIDGAGHWLHAEKPKEFYEVVTRFLVD